MAGRRACACMNCVGREVGRGYEASDQAWELNRVFQKYNLAACIKACLEIQGFAVEILIPPIAPLDAKAGGIGERTETNGNVVR